jgi:hypothetical protein
MGIVLFMDVDETLVYSRRQGEDSPSLPGDKVVMGNTRTYVSAPRPGAKEFLCALSASCESIYALSNGLTCLQGRVLEAHGLMPCLKGVFGRDAYSHMPAAKDCLLVDDADPVSINSIEKMAAMGQLVFQGSWQLYRQEFIDRARAAASRCYFQVPSWRGQPNDDGLAWALPEVLARIKSSS